MTRTHKQQIAAESKAFNKGQQDGLKNKPLPIGKFETEAEAEAYMIGRRTSTTY